MTENTIKKEEILLGIDYGETNIGLAFARNGLVAPLRIVQAKHKDTAVHEIANACHQNKCTKVIIGLPLTENKKETAESIKVRQFTKLLKVYIKIPIIFEDEFLSSAEALQETLTNGLSKKRRRSIDHYSAALILKRYMEKGQES